MSPMEVITSVHAREAVHGRGKRPARDDRLGSGEEVWSSSQPAISLEETVKDAIEIAREKKLISRVPLLPKDDIQ